LYNNSVLNLNKNKMAKEDRDKMPGVEHTYGGKEPSQREKDLNEWRKDHVEEFDIDEDPTKDIHHEVRSAAGDVIEQSYTLNAPEERFLGQETVNGIEISVGWDDSYGDYTIYLPQISLGEEAHDQGIYDQVIRSTRLGSEARKLFKKAKEMANDCKDSYELYLKLEDYCHNELKYDGDDE
jgi:hypothetical protein